MLLVLGDGLLGSVIKNKHTITLTKKEINLEKDSLDKIKKRIFYTNPIMNLDPPFPTNINYPENTYLINAAGYTDVDGAETNQDKAYKTNTEGVYKLAVVCKQLGVTLLHISTDFVFDGISRTPFSEYDQLNPVNYYGYTKMMSEKMIMNSGCKYAIIRAGWLYDACNGLIPKLINKVIEDKPLFGVQDQRLSPTHVRDLSKQIFKIIENNLTGVFHATTDGWTTPVDLLKLISKNIHGEEREVWTSNKCNFLTSGAQRPLNCVLDNMNLKALGLNILPHWKEGVLSLLEKPENDKKTK